MYIEMSTLKLFEDIKQCAVDIVYEIEDDAMYTW